MLFLTCMQMNTLTIVVITPLPVGGRGFVFARFLCFFVCIFVSKHYEKTAGPIYMKFSGNVWSDHGTTWFNFESIRINGSAVRRSFVITSRSSESHCHSLGGSRGLALTSQLHRWQHGAGFVVPRTTACFFLNLLQRKLEGAHESAYLRQALAFNTEKFRVIVFELIAFNAEKFRGSCDPGYALFWKNFWGSCPDCSWEHFCQISSP